MGHLLFLRKWLLPSVPESINKKYFHYLVPEEVLSDDDDRWEGRVLAFDKSLRKESKRQEKRLKEQTRTMLYEFANLRQRCNESAAQDMAAASMTKCESRRRRSGQEESCVAECSTSNPRTDLDARMERLENTLEHVLEQLGDS